MALPILVSDAQILSDHSSNGATPQSVTYNTGVTGEKRCTVGKATIEGGISVTSITLGGQDCTIIGSQADGVGNTIHTFLIVNPPTGSNALSVTSVSDPADICISAVTYQYVNQTNPYVLSNILVSIGVGTGDDELGFYPSAAGNLLIINSVMDGGDSEADVDGLSGMTTVVEDGGAGNDNQGFVSGMYSLPTTDTSEHLIGVSVNQIKDFAWMGFELVGDTTTGGGGDPVPERFSVTLDLTCTSSDFALGWTFTKKDAAGTFIEDATSVVAVTTADTDEILLDATFPTGKPTGTERTFYSYDATVGAITEVTNGGALATIAETEGTTCP